MADSDMKMAVLLFCGDVSFRIGRVLLKAGVHPLFQLKGKLDTWLPPGKDFLGLRTSGFIKSHVCVCAGRGGSGLY